MVTDKVSNGSGPADAPDGHRTFDAVVIGTGFAGAVTACRLVEAEFSVCILERGRRYGPADFPRYPVDDLFADTVDETRSAPIPDFSRWLWSQDCGLYDVFDLEDTIAVQAAGYGGGSLIYANVHLRPPYELFDEHWPARYREKGLEPYFDLAAYMLGATPIPQRLAKTAQMERAGEQSGSAFRLPLAVNFTTAGRNAFNRDQQPCDMRGRCWRGCDRQAKNTLDLNYLARAEDGPDCEVHTLTEATRIAHDGTSFKVFVNDVLPLPRPAASPPVQARAPGNEAPHFRANNVFLCAGALNTTRLLFASDDLWDANEQARRAHAVLGRRYFPNCDSLAIVRNCDEPHEADYGPTITSAVLYDHGSHDLFDWTLDFAQGLAAEEPGPGMWVQCVTSGAVARLVSKPVLDCGGWKDGTATGWLMLRASDHSKVADRAFPPGAKTLFFDAPPSSSGPPDQRSAGSARTVAPLVRQRHWFLVQDGGYPPDLEPLVGVFSSPLWLRRNRYLEIPADDPGRRAASDASLRRPAAGPLRLKTFLDALGATGAGAVNPRRTVAHALNTVQATATFRSRQSRRSAQPLGIIGEQLGGMLPEFFVNALAADRNELINRGVATALPLLARMLDELSVTVVRQIDPSVRRLVSNDLDDEQLIILARGLIRQVLQVLAGSEVAVADKAARIVLEALPDSPMKLADLVARFVLWAIGYDTITGNTAVLLTMGRDTMRGRLHIEQGCFKAELPSRLADRASAAHESVLRDIAANHWHGELRTNPGWTTLGRRVTVHSQGGCPMGAPGSSVTDENGQVHGVAGLYVMDAAAFPVSVGVNPSATITAIAEYKVAEFIRADPKKSAWRAGDADKAMTWANAHRETIDPLNSGTVGTYPVPERGAIGFRFNESLAGWGVDIPREHVEECDLMHLDRIPSDLSAFRDAEASGLGRGLPRIELNLLVETDDLARLVSGDSSLEPVRLQLAGSITFGAADYRVLDSSYLELFVRNGQRRFFRYVVDWRCADGGCELRGVKVLDNEPGFDVWHDTSTVYFQTTTPHSALRGILRVSLDTFLNVQMRSMEVTGTRDPARQSWALLAFYKYFANELTDVYMQRAETIKQVLFELVTSIHV